MQSSSNFSYTGQKLAMFGREYTTKRKRRSYLGVIGNDALRGGMITGGLGGATALGSLAYLATNKGVRQGIRQTLNQNPQLRQIINANKGKLIANAAASSLLATGAVAGASAVPGAIIGGGIGAVRAPFRKKEKQSRFPKYF